MLKLVHSREEVQKLRGGNEPVSFVPTMGALHQGHLSLVNLAHELGLPIWVSIFVNPLQFSQGEDLDRYPRVLGRDLELLNQVGVDYVWAPSQEDIYGDHLYQRIQANPDLTNKLCGLKRIGHFDGVCTVVKILFDLICPRYAVFGQKDYQQIMVIEDMVQRLNLPVQIIQAPICREESGLAMSSRNEYLSLEDRSKAAILYQSLQELKSAKDFAITRDTVWECLLAQGFEPEYISQEWGRVFIAAKLSGVRLIDNL